MCNKNVPSRAQNTTPNKVLCYVTLVCLNEVYVNVLPVKKIICSGGDTVYSPSSMHSCDMVARDWILKCYPSYVQYMQVYISK